MSVSLLQGSLFSTFCRKKKKSKSKSEGSSKDLDSKEVKDLVSKNDDDAAGSGSSRGSPAVSGGSSSFSKKTDAEKRFEAIQKKRVRIRLLVQSRRRCVAGSLEVMRLWGG